ncbi:hypothetical protein AVMA1855_23390 [Acidovorax sp. SUPP1855]|uniref:hypothetical protein n=1 Tax=Acidovorax sp. SUPP1855 TaxID=431774 RepID=UPI0023DE3160|nr:hypothetical protein [Acidovorax sp. SUPP1855]GKS87152.1 hypothetical protein AVMA1855_23390 [Acidovorax sp. SUPP1855]
MATAKKPTSQPAAPQQAAMPSTREEFERKALVVVPKRAGFRRAGYAFPDGETTIPMKDLKGEQYLLLIREPMLVTYMVDLPADAAGETSEPPQT